MTQWTSHDQAVIEDVLKQAMANETDYQAILAYQEVLNKLHGKTEGNSTRKDGFRYDYDDSSNI